MGDEQQAIHLAWQAVRDRFTEDQVLATDLQIASIETQLSIYFRETFAPLATRVFKVPEDYKEFLRICDRRGYEDGWFIWFDPDWVIWDTKDTFNLQEEVNISDMEIWRAMRSYDQVEKGSNVYSLWITIANWSDKHSIWLCCDEGIPAYNAVMDCHDGNPWMPKAAGGNQIIARSFVEYLQDYFPSHNLD